ncbi:collagen alpha-2(VIII) chain-like [Mya arenaria]|uniref:collagen alpha-2(VIII) chain-like n=1 Tax=Mya arenaria TaxID=6604 RepID=UPI0022E74E18|nr:collagen alpha-2(VIII) chain-like [Mya arenaria]
MALARLTFLFASVLYIFVGLQQAVCIQEDKTQFSDIVKAIAGLELRISTLEGENAKLRDENAEQRTRIDTLNNDISFLKKLIPANEHVADSSNEDHTRKKNEGTHKDDKVALTSVHLPASRVKKTLNGEIAFTAYLDHDVSNIQNGNTVILNKIVLNDGHGYNPATGVFTAQIAGTYFFTFTIRGSLGYTNVQLLRDGDHIVGIAVEATQALDNSMSTNAAVFRLEQGESAWLQAHWQGASLVSRADFHHVTFTGFLLY